MGAADSKLAFRKGVFRLYEEKNISVTDNEFWESFWNLPESADDIFSLIGANDIRRTRDSARENIEVLIDKVLQKMETILKAKNFPSEQNSINQLLNCYECSAWEETFFWTPRQIEKETKTSDNKPEFEILPCRGEVLLKMTIQALFLAGFTIPISLATKESKVVYTIWENGVGSTIPISSYKDNESNRTEVLRLLTVLLSKSMYIPPSQLLSKEDLWLRFVAVKVERKVVLVMLCSLLNTICNYDPTGWVPYNHVVNGGPREQLVSFCLTTLLILLDYRSPHQAELMRQHDNAVAASPTHDLPTTVEVLTLENPEAIPKTSVELEVFTPSQQGSSHQRSEENAFRHYMSKLHRKQDFEFLMDGIQRLLANPMTAVNTYLPGSTKRVGCYIDVMMVCWRLLETNTRFTKYLVETDRVLDLTVSLVFHAIDNKDRLSQIGLVRMCAFMLQTLSSSKEYSVKLNKPFVTHSSLPASIRLYAFNGTYADFLIISIFSMIASTQGRLSTLYPSLILTISNISPYLINLGVTTVSKLMTLFHSMSSPAFLLADELNFQLTCYILEAFNNIVHYHFAENSNLIYSIVLHHDYFEKLDKLTFTDAVNEVERMRLLRESKQEVNATGTTDSAVDSNVEASTTTFATKSYDTEDSTGPVESLEMQYVKKEHEVGSSTYNEDNEQTESEQPKENELSKESAAGQSEVKGKEVEKNNITEKEEEALHTGEESKENKLDTEIKPLIPEASSSEPAVIPVRHDSEPVVSTTPTIRSRSGFIPTEPWMAFWKDKLPLATILALIKHLVPKVEEKCKELNDNITLEELMQFLKGLDVKEALPDEDYAIFLRRFQWGEALVIWFRSMMWGQNYVSSMKEHGAWNGTHVKLFQIKEE
ncbi:unnamed protein product [Mucor hiemalis]